jgi:tripartite ATP-independent transporter DctP family solute receptor
MLHTTCKTFCASVAVAFAALLPWTTAQAQVHERTLKIAYQTAKEHPQSQGAAKLAEIVAAKTNGKIKINNFPSGVLGGDIQTVSALQGGTIELTVLGAGLLSGQVKEMGVFDIPFLFESSQEFDAVVDGPIGQKLFDLLPDKGLVGLAYMEFGFRHLTNSKRPVSKVDDIAGLKIRVAQAPVYIDLMTGLGANATPMPYPELYSALEQKAIDGQENPLTSIWTSKFYEAQKYLALTRHIFGVQALIMSRKSWNSLSNDEKKIFSDAAREAAVYQRHLNRSVTDETLAKLKKEGMQVTEFSPEEMAKFRERARPVIDKYSVKVGDPLAKEVMAEIAKVRR